MSSIHFPPIAPGNLNAIKAQVQSMPAATGAQKSLKKHVLKFLDEIADGCISKKDLKSLTGKIRKDLAKMASGGCGKPKGCCCSKGGDPIMNSVAFGYSAKSANGQTQSVSFAFAASSSGGGQVRSAKSRMMAQKMASLGKGGMSFERMVHEFMKDVVEEQQKKVKGLMKKAKAAAAAADGKGGGAGGAKGAGGKGGAAGENSMAVMMEDLKFEIQTLTQMMQALSAINNTMHQNSMNSIRKIAA